MMVARKKLPTIFIIGATATGKSKLAVEIAKKFGSEVVGADSMQVYKGLNIATNKVSPEETSHIRHHMIDFLDPGKKYTVIDYKRQALSVINDLIDRNILPIVVGGTMYYIESLMWQNITMESPRSNELNKSNQILEQTTLMDKETKRFEALKEELIHTNEDLNDIERFFSKPIIYNSFVNIPSEKLWTILEKVDPQSSCFIHPNNKRKIVRALQVRQDNNESYSKILNKVNTDAINGGTRLGGSLRFQPTIVFWLCADLTNLRKIVADRVDEMLEKGLLEEMEAFYRDYRVSANLSSCDYEKGILQTIGFKEFDKYLRLNPDEKHSPEGQKILEQSIQSMKVATAQYAKRQNRWIKQRFLRAHDHRDLPYIFKIDAHIKKEDWGNKILNPAFQIVRSFRDNIALDDKFSRLLVTRQDDYSDEVRFKPGKYFCDTCDKLLIGSHSIEDHLRSRTHKAKKGRPSANVVPKSHKEDNEHHQQDRESAKI